MTGLATGGIDRVLGRVFFGVQGSGFRGLGFRVQGLVVLGLGLRAWAVGLKVHAENQTEKRMDNCMERGTARPIGYRKLKR